MAEYLARSVSAGWPANTVFKDKYIEEAKRTMHRFYLIRERKGKEERRKGPDSEKGSGLV